MTNLARSISAEGTKLTSPLVLARGPVIANRLVRAALSEGLGDKENNPSSNLIRLYRRWAVRRGFGLVVTGNVMVDRCQLGDPGNVVVEDDRALDLLREWSAAAKSRGALVWMQINHPGRQAMPMLTGNRAVAPSAIRAEYPGAVVPRELHEEEIWDIVRRFAATAKFAQAAGFDGVQLHGAHGYLISQFLSPLANNRNDSWGGDPDRRMRFVLEVLAATRAAVGQNFPIGIKLNSADFQKGGFSQEESMDVVEALARRSIDMVEVSGGTYSAPAMMGKGVQETTKRREAYFQDYAEKARQRTPGLALMLTGGFRSAAGMQGALDDDACDLIGIARAACTDPEIGAKILSGTQELAPVVQTRAGGRWLLGKITDVRAVDGAIDLSWHVDQMHRMGSGKDPDLGRAWYRTTLRALQRNGWSALRRRRG